MSGLDGAWLVHAGTKASGPRAGKGLGFFEKNLEGFGRFSEIKVLRSFKQNHMVKTYASQCWPGPEAQLTWREVSLRADHWPQFWPFLDSDSL